ncbi:MAG: ATP-binding protein [Bacteroidota bacterium]
MNNSKNMEVPERINLLEAELKELEENLAQKHRAIEVEKALEKVRVKALEMRNSSELSETSAILFQQLKELNIDAVRSGLGIFDDENNAIELWITSIADNGKLFFVLEYINVQVHPVFENIFESRKSNQPYALTILEGKDLLNYYRVMSVYGDGIQNKRETVSSEYFYSFFFSEGAINVVAGKALTGEEADIMLRMAKVFGLLYTRFLDLKRLEDQADLIRNEKKILESTLDNLKAAQNQLIQSEKMASLGQLTAGIAHEIQNPLNFVNNFSELTQELLTEMCEEIKGGNYELAIALAKDISSNHEKINFHGKRADAIVKSMLQHSLARSGTKELTDINALSGNYSRLAYHNFQSKESQQSPSSSLQVTLHTDFDNSISVVNVIPQEIGRAILNLMNNAFYEVAEKAKYASQSSSLSFYEPVVSVSTKKIISASEAMEVEIKVADNGNGIQQNIIDKIFQPFFTTKPTGQGTGLGLSLAYDIIKAHGGEIKVNTTVGEGSEFIIQLPIT